MTLLSYLAGYKSNLSDLKIPSCIDNLIRKKRKHKKGAKSFKNDPEIILKKLKCTC